MQTSPPQQHHMLHAQVELEATSDKMTGSNPVSPASSGSPSSSGSISPSHLTHDSSLDSHLSFDGPKSQNRALVSSGMYISPDPASMWDKTHAEIAEQAKHEAEIENRIAEMKKEGFWSLKRLSKVPEPIRPKVHWDYLCEEMQWLSADFAQERRWKRGVARKVVRMVIRHHEEQKQKEERAKREEQAKLRRIASSIAKEVKQFWSNVEKVVQFKQQSRLEEKRKKALDLQLDFIVGQTEKYSDLLTQSLNETLPVPSKTSGSRAGSTASSPPPPAQLIEDDGDFQPHEESDDEETIEAEEQQEGNDSETQLREIELLKQESELPLEELLQTLPSQILENSFSVSPCASSSDNDDEEEGDSEEEVEQEESQTSETLKQEKPKPVTQRNKKPWKPDEEDEEFTANEEEAEDVEETIDAEEKLEGNVDHSKELDDLAKEGELPMEELLQKYAGAYASDFEVEASDTSSEALEPSTSEYEEESEEENSTSHSDSTEEIEESEQEESEVEDALEERRDASVIQEEDFGVEYLLKQDDDNGGEGDNDSAPAPGPKKEITDIAAAAESLQPKGYTLATTQVKTPIPYLLRGTLREYQHIGLDWLVTMYEKKLNGILADEMGLGKTIQTISLLAHLACEKGSWGPHLIIVPTSVMLNWEMEIKRWCPSFKILTYYGAQKERKLKRQGWTKPNAFHICITSYKLVLQDHQAFRRKNWKYLILDEAQNIKNFKSQRWQSLLNFNSQRRLLLTGTPLQNSLMELWSLMHFLMPHVFQSHREFKEWFSNPLTGMIEGSQEYNENLVKRLHKVLRPFLLRRVKVDVEKQMPKKYEHVIKCRLSKRQRYLYDDFMAQATTKETLATGHFMSVINILMQLRKVCNHPNLFDPRPIHSPFITEGICFRTASLVLHALGCDPLKNVDLGIFDLINLEGSVSRYETDTFLPKWKVTRKMIEEIAESPDPPPRPKPVKMKVNRMLQPMPKPENRTVVLVNSPRPTAPLQRPITPVLPESLTPALAPGPHPGPGLPGPLPPTPLPVSLSLPVPIPMPPSSMTMSVPVPPPARPQTPTLVPTLSQNNPAAALLQSQASVPQVLPMAMTAAQLAPNTPRPLLSPPPVSPTTTSSLKAAPVPLPMGQQPPVSSLSATTVRQKAPTNTLSITSVQQQPPISTLGISPMAQQPPTNTQSINTLSISPLNTLGVPPVGGQQPPPTNPLGPGPAAAAAQQSTSAVGMVKPMNIHSAVPTLPGYNFAAAAGGVQQRLLLSPDMQARLPSGEVVSIGQLASLANRPLQGAPGSKPLTFQIQGNKLTLTGTQVRQVTMPQPARQLPRNVVHLVSPGGQHHIISQPAQVALIQAMAQQAGQNPVGVQNVPGHQPPTILPVPATSTTVPPVASTATISVPIAVTQVPSSAVNSSGVVKIVVRQAPRDGLVSPAPGPQHPPMRPVTPTTASTLPGLPTALLAQRAPLPVNPVSSVRLPNQPLVPVRPPAPAPLQTLVRPMLRMIQASNPNLEQQLVPPSPPPTVASFAISPAATVTVSANTSPTMVSQIASSPMPKEEPEMLTLRSTTPTPPPPLSILAPRPRRQPPPPPRSPFFLEALEDKRKKQKEERLDRLFRLNEQHCNLVPIYGTEVLRFCSLFPPAPPAPQEKEEEKEEVMAEASDERARATQKVEPKGSRGSGYTHCYAAQVQRSAQHLEAYWQRSETLAQAILTPKQRIEELTDIIERFIFVMPPVEAPAITMHTSHPPPTLLLQQSVFKETLRQELSPHASCLHRIICNMRTQFPDLRLIQYDCGKLQTLDILLRQLKAGSHRVLIFTQMTRMLDVLEQFLNYHGHIYLRLDGSTRVEQRQALMERFNADKRIFCFILSTRSGGVGVNLTGADTVVFYDSDWNPTMDAQAQDRCHRIGQTRDVHIYRLISERTVEENILKKANQKRMLGDMAIEGGNFTTAYFKQQTIRELFDMPLDEPTKKEGEVPVPVQEEEEDPMATKQTQILEQALCKAEDPEDIRAATQAKAEQVAELAEFNENIPLDAEDRSSKEEEEEISKAEQEIASLVEQLTPIERYAMNFLEASLEDISREELKQAEEQVEAARKDIDQAKDEVVFKLPEDEDESYLLEEGSSKKSKKARFPSRIGSERPGTRMSERLRSTRLPPKDGDGRDVESSQSRLPNLRHSRMVTDEDDNLPQVAQHTRSASVRRELVREEKRAQIVPNTRRTLTRREELWNKGPSSGEKVQKMPPHRSEASGDRFLRANLHRTDTPSAGDKWLQAAPQKSDPGVAGDRILRGTTSKTETLVVDERLPGSVPQASDTNLDKGPRLGLQKPEKTSGPDKLTCSSPKSEGSRTEVKAPEFHLQGLDGEAFKLKADVEEQKTEEISQLGPPILDFHPVESAADKEVPAFQEQDTQVTGKSLGTQTLPDAGKLNIPGSKMKATTPVPLGTVKLTSESKSEATGEINLPVIEPKMSAQKPTEEVDVSTSYHAAEGESVNSADEATRQISTRETTAPDDTAKVVSEPLSSKSTKDTTWETAGSAASFMLDSEVPKMDTPVFTSLDHSPATSSLLQLETLTCIKEQNGLKESLRSGDLPSRISSLLTEPQLEILPLGATSPISQPADYKVNSLDETTTQNQGAVGKNNQGEGPQETRLAAVCPGSASSQESSSLQGNLSSDDSLSPNKPPRRRTSADVQIQKSCQTPDGPAAKVLRKLPGRLVTVVEEKELIRRRRNRMCKLDSTPSAVINLGSGLAQSLSEPEIPPSTKALPLLRDLPARRRIELESRAAAKEKDDGSKGELLGNTSSEPVKRKRGRPPKNKSPDQKSPGLLRPFPEPALEISPQRKALVRKTPEDQAGTQSPEQKVPESSTPKSESPKSKTDSSENGDSPVEKRRRGRPPKTRQSPVMPPKSPASEVLLSPSTKPQTVELPIKVKKKPQRSPEAVSVTEGPSKLHEPLDLHPKTAVSKTSPKARNRTSLHSQPGSDSNSSLKGRELLTVSTKALSKPSTDVCEPRASSPRGASATEASPEMQDPPYLSPVSRSLPKGAPSSPATNSPPKRKRGRPPKNPSSPRVEVAQPPASNSDQETSLEKHTPAPPGRKRRRRRRKDELGPSLPSANQSSSDGEDTRPLTRLALLKREEKPESCSGALVQPSPKHKGTERASSAESSTWEQPSSDTPARSTRLRPGCLVPPLERETQRRKRRCSVEGKRVRNSSKSPASRGISEQEGGESESSLKSSSESNSYKCTQQPKRQCYDSARGHGRKRGQGHQSGMADRILRSAVKPADSTRSGSSPIPPRKTGPAFASSAAGVTGALSSPTTPSSTAPVTSSQSNRGRKPKT
ncbi:helicase SRCAP isoform X1 [Crotalus tigris]|uniref:helicase SRCAP isoform X1 n=1 Tax=Crotalus tigris TaxID=88082 RepID=UPI00192FA37D|nr:helicase SRCAP isoform X1 [Crotalus tigris]XP_039186433.1 helicase SRCAP isoform X1 [Crotalus tigris]XP_039186435.1 helicase SRCAP isoform X1 [Crotalus tigris]